MLYDEAERRDHGMPALDRASDGTNHQIDVITAEASAREEKENKQKDNNHDIEYLWKAAWASTRPRPRRED